MFTKDSIGNIERHSIYLLRPSGTLLGCLDEYIDEDSANLVCGLNQQYKLSFEINRLNNGWYEYIQEGMYLVVETIGIFKLKQPQITNNGFSESKSVTAYSCDNELEDKNIDLEINMGTKTSMEYLVEYSDDDADEEIINPYTGIPYDWLVLYNTFPEQLTAHLADYDDGVFGTPSTEITVTDTDQITLLDDLFTMIPRLKSSFTKTVDAETGATNYTLVEYADVNYNDDGDTIVSIVLYTTYRARIVRLIDFYTNNREQLSLLSVVLEKTNGAWKVGDVYGVSDGDYTLANKKYQFDISENIYSFLTTTLAQTINCMVTFDIFNRTVNVTPVENIGTNTGIILSYDNLLNDLNIESNEDDLSTRLIVTGSDDLSISEVNFGLGYVDDLAYKMNAVDEDGNRIYVSDTLAQKYSTYIDYCDSVRSTYVRLSTDYRKYNEQIDEIMNRVPLDDLKTDWGTYTEDELATALTTYNNLLVSLITLYRNEYYAQGINADESVNETFMATTVYWQDYVAYKEAITQIQCAIDTFPYYSDSAKWTDAQKTTWEDAIKAWETEWTLYGVYELQAKISAYKNNMDVLAESSVIRVSSDSDVIKAWNALTDAEKAEFGGDSNNYKYDEYMEYYNNMLDAQDYLEDLQTEVSTLETARDTSETQRQAIIDAVAWENNFTSRETKELALLIREADCNNDNILVTNIDSSEEKIERMNELLEYGQEQLSKLSRPQLTFTITSDNLLALTDFESFWEDFQVGNFLMVQYRDNTYVKLRMVGYEYNPCLPSSEQFTITFSNSVRSKVGVSDLENILGLSATNSSRSSSSSGGSGSGTYGESDDIDVAISNTMLAKLLNSELFGTRVSDVILNTINVNSITAKYATFGGLAEGTTTIDGQCIVTGWIQSTDYNGSGSGAIDNTAGSIINLNNGIFSLGGGGVTYNGSVLNIGDGGITYDGTALTISGSTELGSSTVSQALADIVTAQETADGKTTIYYGTTSGTYSDVIEGDYLVDSTDGSTYRWSADSSSWVLATDYSSAITEAITDLEEELVVQIDAKIETWAQLTDPSESWDADTLESHDGDLWYYIGITSTTVDGVTILPTKTYQYDYSTGLWVLYDSPNTSLFDFADGKCTIFYGLPTDTFTNPSPEEGDYLVDNTDSDNAGCTYRYVSDAWVKITDYKAYTQSYTTNAVNDLQETLEEQIDAKIETWATSTNPALSWSSSEYINHIGDLWLYSGLTDITVDGVTIHPQGVYIFTTSTVLDESGDELLDESGNPIRVEGNYIWEAYSSVSSNLFDLADGKTTIYYGTTSGSYDADEGDYLVDNTKGMSYRWNGTSWVAVTKTGNLYGTCSTASTTQIKVVSCDESIALYEGLTISVCFTNANTYYSDSNPLALNVGTLGVKNIYYNGNLISSTNRMYWTAGATIMFMYDGTGWIVVGHPQSYSGSCSTAANTVSKVCSITDAVIVKGTIVNITFTYTNSASSSTLSVISDDTNAPIITVDSSNTTLSSSSQYNWNAGATVGFTFDGTYWKINDTSALYNTNSYMRFESAYGLMIANMSGGVANILSTTMPNVLITSGFTYSGTTYDTGVYIREGQEVAAKFDTDSIELGNSDKAYISIEVNEDSDGYHNGVFSFKANSINLGDIFFGSEMTPSFALRGRIDNYKYCGVDWDYNSNDEVHSLISYHCSGSLTIWCRGLSVNDEDVLLFSGKSGGSVPSSVKSYGGSYVGLTKIDSSNTNASNFIAVTNNFTVDTSGNMTLDGGLTLGGAISATGTIDAAIESATVSDTDINNGFSTYDTNSTVTFRKFGKVVNLCGALINGSAITLNKTLVKVFDVPNGYKPSQAVVSVCQGSDAYIFTVRVSSNGYVYFERYRNSSSFATAVTGSWFPFNITWIID